MKRLSALGIGLIIASGSSNLRGDEGMSASLYVVHGIPGQDLGLDPELAVDIEVNDVCALQGFTFGDIAGPLSLPEGNYAVSVSLANEDVPCGNEPLFSEIFALSAGFSYSVVANLTEVGNPTLSAFVNDLSEAARGRARLQVRHLAEAPSVDITVRRGMRAVVAQIEEFVHGDEATAELRPGNSRVWISPTGTDDVVFGPVVLRLTPNTLFQVFAVGSVQSGSFTLLVLDVRLDGELDD